MSFTQAAHRSLVSWSRKAATARQLPRSFLERGQPRKQTMVSATSPVLEKRKIKVPSMGDSITEGTIIEWTAAVGQAVKEDDVVALIETDKVTVEIKAEMSGVVVDHFGAVEETVEVGAYLYEIDTDIAATVNTHFSAGLTDDTKSNKKSTPPPPPPAEKTEAVAATAASAEEDHAEKDHHRTPGIKFLGKDGWIHLLSAHDEVEKEEGHSSLSPAPKKATSPAAPTNVIIADSSTIPPMYGRPRFTEGEMEALISGGADGAPKVVKQSGGAKFAYL